MLAAGTPDWDSLLSESCRGGRKDCGFTGALLYLLHVEYLIRPHSDAVRVPKCAFIEEGS